MSPLDGQRPDLGKPVRIDNDPFGATHFAWDGRDDAGKELPDGVSLARLLDAAHPEGARPKIAFSRGWTGFRANQPGPPRGGSGRLTSFQLSG